MMHAIAKLLLIAVFLGIPSFAFAHGKSEHVLGTVTAIADERIVVKTVKGSTVTLGIRPSTTFTAKGSTSPDRPQVGDRLVADVTKTGVKKGEDWVAVAITFGTPQHRSSHGH
ncbi:MAG: hypothetical protein D6690_02960 [Nitrospirae bacterium]|nr:MAG: hypothetical protein D6690_02960 [Nitrospirota bacterium]